MTQWTHAIRCSCARAILCWVAFFGTTSVIVAQTSVSQAPPVSGDAVTMTEVVQSALGDYPLIHITQEEFNAC